MIYDDKIYDLITILYTRMEVTYEMNELFKNSNTFISLEV